MALGFVVCGMALVVLGARASRVALDEEVPDPRASGALAALGAELRPLLDPEEPVIVRSVGSAVLIVGPGVVVDLERHGYQAYTPERNLALRDPYTKGPTGGPCFDPPDESAAVVDVVVGREEVDRYLADDPGAVVVAANSLSRAEEAELLELRGRISPAVVFDAVADPAREDRHGPVEGHPDTSWEDVNRLLELLPRDLPVLVVEPPDPVGA
jgi:hypothetical protein